MSGTSGPSEAGTGHAFAIECPGCHAHVAVSGDQAGRPATCPLCHAIFVVPSPSAAEHAMRESAEDVDAAPDMIALDLDPALAANQPNADAMLTPADEPLVFHEPPIPSTRRPADEHWSHVAADAAPPTPADDGAAIPAPLPPTGDDMPVGLTFHEPVKTVRSGGTEIELRRLSPEERHTRRARRNLIMLVVGAALLVALVVMLTQRGR